MGIRFRKSLNFGPFRINFSKSGVGFSAGVKGFRVTKKATGGVRATASLPGTGISYVKDFKSSNPSQKNNGSSEEITKGDIPPENQNKKSKTVEFVLCLLLGWLGVHKFYKRKIGMGILYLFTFGLFTIGWLGDTILLLISMVNKGKSLGSKKTETAAKVGAYGGIVLLLALLVYGCGSNSPSEPTEPTDPDQSIMATQDTAGTTLPAATDPTTLPTEEPTAAQTQPATEPPTTEPAVTEPSATTAPPATNPPATEPSATESPNTDPPATTATPATNPPATDPPVTNPPATEAAGITFLLWPQTTSRNEDATVRVQGKPNTQYSITVMYMSGPSTADGLEPKTSDGDGYVSWTWHVGGRTTPGTYTITVSGGGESETVQFTVVE